MTVADPVEVLRYALAEAEGGRRNGPASDGRGWFRSDADREECFAVADTVPADVLGEARRMLAERER